MFDSVLDRGVIPRRKLGTGAVVSVLGHAAVLSVALMIRPPTPEPEPTKVPLVILPPMFTQGGERAPAGTGGPPPPARHRRGPRPPSLLAPAKVPMTPPKVDIEAPPNEAITGGFIGDLNPDGPAGPPDSKGTGTGVPDGDPNGHGTCTGGACEFVSGAMTAPILLERGRDPAYTHEALEARVEGKMTVQCVVTLAGRLEQCRVLRPVPLMERAVVEALMTRRYAPATQDGKPLAVRYTFQVQLVLPR